MANPSIYGLSGIIFTTVRLTSQLVIGVPYKIWNINACHTYALTYRGRFVDNQSHRMTSLETVEGAQLLVLLQLHFRSLVANVGRIHGCTIV